MVVCKYFLQGNCRFGDQCRNEHPSSAGFANPNRFGALSNQSNRFGAGSDVRKDATWSITANDVRNDLTDGKGRPKWILSTYGPGRGAPASLFDGNECSPEEVRLRFYQLAAQGKETEADQEAIALWNKADQAMKDVANNADNVIKFMEEAEKKHPNRYDFCKADGTKTREQIAKEAESQSVGTSLGFAAGTGFGQGPTPNPFSKPAASTFGQASTPSAFGSSTLGKPAFGQSGFGGGFGAGSAFGKPATTTAFGQPSSPSTLGKPAFGGTGFGQPSFGQPSQPTPTFGQPSAFGQPPFGSSGFGPPAQKNPFAAPSAAGAFSQTSTTFGQPAQPSTRFGQPSSPSSAFGRPSQSTPAFGQQSQPAPAFGQASQPTSTFGQPSQPSVFGKPGFGQPSQPTSTFGQPSQPTATFGQPSQPTSTFGRPSQPTSTFGQPSQPTSAFGQPSPASVFGQPSQPTATFGQPASSTFGQPSTSTSTGFGQPAATGRFGTTPALSGTFGQAAPSSPFALADDQTMETTSPGPVGPLSPFGKSASPVTGPGALTSEPAPPASIPSAPIKVNVNTSSKPHPLTGRPPKPVHYTQTLPPQPNQKNASQQLTSYRGRRVQYLEGAPCYERPDGQGWERIWFPDAGATPDVVALNKEDKLHDLQAPKDQYTDAVLDQYRYLLDEGRFRDGKLPLVPPLREWCVYDF